MKKLEGGAHFTLSRLWLNKSYFGGKKYLTQDLICSNTIQYEAREGKESKNAERHPGLFANASGEPGGVISEMWKERVSM